MNQELEQRIHSVEIMEMGKRFPQFTLHTGDGSLPFAPKGTVFWGGYLRTNNDQTYSVAVTYPVNFPNGSIRAYVKELMGVNTPHKYHDGHLCLYSNDHGGPGEGGGRETTAATVVGWTAAWLNAYEVYKAKGVWPGK